MRAPWLVPLVVVAGCGGGGDAPRETRDADQAQPSFERFQQCLHDNGVQVPEPSEGGPTIVQPPPVDVRRKCERFLPKGGPQMGPHQAPLPQSPGP